jgi:hypothetical protein
MKSPLVVGEINYNLLIRLFGEERDKKGENKN